MYIYILKKLPLPSIINQTWCDSLKIDEEELLREREYGKRNWRERIVRQNDGKKKGEWRERNEKRGDLFWFQLNLKLGDCEPLDLNVDEPLSNGYKLSSSLGADAGYPFRVYGILLSG